MTTTNPNCSIILCVYNRADQILCCLDSILAMDRRDYEIVLVDDASTDETPATLASYAKAHESIPIRIVRNAENLGVSGARNAGIVAAGGEFVFFTDSDCLVQQDWLDLLLQGFQDPDVAAVAGTVVDTPPRNLVERAYCGGSKIGRSRLQGRGLIGGNMGFRRELLAQFLFDDALQYGCDEDDVAMRMKAHGHQILFIPQAVVYHDHPLDLGSYLRMAFGRGKGSARFWYKCGRYIGRDLWAVMAALIALPLGMIDVRLLVIPLFFFVLQLAAIVYNQMAFKGKGLIEALTVLPIDVLYYACRTWSVLTTLLAITLGNDGRIRESKRRWLESLRAERTKQSAA